MLNMNATQQKLDYRKTALDIISKVHLIQCFNEAPDALLVLGSDRNPVALDKAAQKLLGYTTDEVSKLTIQILIPDWFDVVTESCISQPFTSEQPINTMVVSKRGKSIDVELKLIVITEERENFLLVALQNKSVNPKTTLRLETIPGHLRAKTSELEKLPDPYLLSGLLNPQKLESILAKESINSRKTKTILLAALINLDDFTRVNATYGYESGDTVLKGVLKIIKNKLRTIDWVGSIGGDEFLAFLPCKTIFTGASVIEGVREAIHQNSIIVGNHRIDLNASIGIVSLPIDISSIDEVLRLTRATLKESKEGGKNCITVDDGIFGGIIRIPAN